MGILNSASRTLRRLAGGKVGGLGEKFRDSRLNVGSWGEDIARGFGIQTRKRVASGLKRNVEGPEGRGVSSAFPRQEIDVLSNKLNTAGYLAQGAGYGAAGTLGYKLSAGGDTSPRDANGVKNPMSSEELVKSREKFQMERMGGSKKFSAPIYDMVAKDSQWVKTAIESMGMDKYKKYRAAVIQDPSRASQLHDILVKELAKTGDSEMMKQAAKEAYVLPGLANVNGKKRVVVMNPSKNKDKQTSFQALQYDYEDEEGNE